MEFTSNKKNLTCSLWDGTGPFYLQYFPRGDYYTLSCTPQSDIFELSFTDGNITEYIAFETQDYYTISYSNSSQLIQIDINDIELWSAESPILYTLLIRTENEVIKERIGMREVKIENSVLKINNVPVKLKGVNHHDSDPVKGYVVNYDDLLVDLKLMKECNINSIRTSHYPKAPIFY